MKIFIADYLPLANKGEEEILRGIETLFKKTGKEEISFSVFGDVHDVQHIGNVTVYPKYFCYPDYKLRGKKKVLADIGKALLNYFGIYPYKTSLIRQENLLSELKSADVILLGHDGFFNLRCAMLGNYIHKLGLHYGIFGAGFNRPSQKIAWIYDKVYGRCFNNANYVILREQTAYKYVKSISTNSVIELLPDPAFFCPSDVYDAVRVGDVLSKYGIDRGDKLCIGMTICEDSISFSKAFESVPNRIEAHREFIVELINKISNERKCSFYFLPHCIKEGKGNDLHIAKDIKARLGHSIDCQVIEEDLPVFDLKYIISKMDVVLGERTHSIINSIATSTPFVSITCTADFRTHDIVGAGCQLYQQIYDLDRPKLHELYEIVDRTIRERDRIQIILQNICEEHSRLKSKFQELI